MSKGPLAKAKMEYYAQAFQNQVAWGAGLSIFHNFDHHVDEDEGEGREARLITGTIRKILVVAGMLTATVLLEI